MATKALLVALLDRDRGRFREAEVSQLAVGRLADAGVFGLKLMLEAASGESLGLLADARVSAIPCGIDARDAHRSVF